MNKKIVIMCMGLLFGVFLISLTLAADISYCCEKTKVGAYCQNAPQNECDTSSGFRSTPASCEATSFCQKGFCYDSKEGICDENTPEKVCEIKGGVWEKDKGETPLQCQLGCCLIGDQAAFVTQVRCKRLSSLYGLEIDFRSNVNDEFSCIALAQTQEEGACVIDNGVEKTCKRTTSGDCDKLKAGGNGTDTNFKVGILCSAEELGTDCAPTEKTECIDGKDEVYFVDSCGNLANIYDSSKVNDKNYWKEIKGKDESCNPASANAGSSTCGNCNYLGGSICQRKTTGESVKYGNNICKDLSCEFKGQEYQHGETFCGTDEKDVVGSTYYRYTCFNGDVSVEACDQFRNKICIQDEVNGYRSAACRANMWEDCYSQEDQQACENEDARDCKWMESKIELSDKESSGLFGKVGSGAKDLLENINPLDDSDDEKKKGKTVGICVPDHAPGFNFWQDGSAQGICSLGNAQCVVTYEKTTLGKKQCVENCECLEKAWEDSMNNVCISLGDCGGKENWIGSKGYTQGYKIGVKKVDTESGSSGSADSSGSTTPSAPTQRIEGASGSGERIQGATGGIIRVGEEWTNNITP